MSVLTSRGNSVTGDFPIRPILTAAEMRACDNYTITALGVPSQVLMERAAEQVVDYLLRRTDLFPAGRVLILCGSGNNGGDGLAVARFLTDGSHGAAREVSVIYVGGWTADGSSPDTTSMSAECARQYRLLRETGVAVLPPDRVRDELCQAVCVVDAMLGIGLNCPVRGRILEIIERVIRSGLPVLAVDIPTGIHADSGAVMGLALPARATVTMQALKAGLLLYPGADLCGDIAVADIGISTAPAETPMAHLADRALLRRVVCPRARRSHKGSYGRVLAVCGSCGMSGAAVLCARGALRSGAGLAEVLTPEENRLILQISVPEAIVSAYDAGTVTLGAADDAAVARRAALIRQIRAAVGRASAVVVGCGLGLSDTARLVLRTVLEAMPRDRRVPLLLDADALNLLAEDTTLWETRGLSAPDRCVILTPHPAEMARLCAGNGDAASLPVSVILDDPVAAASRFAARHGVTVVLKDAHTVVAAPSGERYICPFGNAGMATGGSGDVLAGVIGALLAQQLPRDASAAAVTAAGVALHALAGDAAAHRLGECGMLPSDLIEQIPVITKDFPGTATVLEHI